MSHQVNSEQEAYYLGYANPATAARYFDWAHVVDVNAFRCGQIDYQNQAPRNREYDRRQYDPVTFERSEH